MSNDDLYIEAFSVGHEYKKLLNKTVDIAFSKAMERVKDGLIDSYIVWVISLDQASEIIGLKCEYVVCVILHFGVYDTVAGCCYDYSPMYRFDNDVCDHVLERLKDSGIGIIDD